MLLALAVALAPLPAPPLATADDALRWGRIGHRLVARLATGRLSDRAKREVRLLLGDETMASVASWGDQIRAERPETGPWHYVNIPVIDSVYRPALHCPDTCIVRAAEAQIAILSDHRQPRAARAEALKWVIHLLGDMHQPLHAGDRGDRGGNDVTVWFRFRRTNLHSLWDSGLIEANGIDEQQMLSRLERTAAARDTRPLTSGSVADWVLESHDIARDFVYPRLSAWLFITPGYASDAEPVIEEQLLRAGVRLAAVLERAL